MTDYLKLTGADDFIEIDGGSAGVYYKADNVGYIGTFTATDESTARTLINLCICKLKQHNCKKIIAPLDGATWFKYRLVSYSNGQEPFLLEPQNPMWYNDILIELGFTPIKKYRSDIFPLEKVQRLEKKSDRFTIRNISKADIQNEMKVLYDLSINGFDDNFLYSKISEQQFYALYQGVIPIIDEDLVCIAEIDSKPVGFFFAINGGNDTLILKTVAVLPECRSMGIAAYIMNHVMMNAKDKGYKTAIAALISEGNNSHKIVSKYGSEKMREYTLYSLEV